MNRETAILSEIDITPQEFQNCPYMSVISRLSALSKSTGPQDFRLSILSVHFGGKLSQMGKIPTFHRFCNGIFFLIEAMDYTIFLRTGFYPAHVFAILPLVFAIRENQKVQLLPMPACISDACLFAWASACLLCSHCCR